jgi:hypothetical protein
MYTSAPVVAVASRPTVAPVVAVAVTRVSAIAPLLNAQLQPVVPVVAVATAEQALRMVELVEPEVALPALRVALQAPTVRVAAVHKRQVALEERAATTVLPVAPWLEVVVVTVTLL